MCQQVKHLIFIFLLIPVAGLSQEKMDFTRTDSITYRYYLDGDWTNLIRTGLNAIESGMDYKFLRQRLGYAYFSKGEYYEAGKHFEKALSFDSWDPFTLEYLIYSYRNTGREEYAGVLVSRTDTAALKRMHIKPFRPVESIDLEFDYKYAATELRSDPLYGRIGVASYPGYRFYLYQSVYRYHTVVTPGEPGSFNIGQTGYYANVSYNASLHLVLSAAWHHMIVSSGASKYSDNLFRLSAATDLNRFAISFHASLLDMDQPVWQAGAGARYVFPGKAGFYIKGDASALFKEDGYNMVFNPAAGFKLFRGVWIEANVTSGNMQGYNDFNGLYVYNTIDPAIFRSGGTMYVYLGRSIILWINYSYERKRYYEDNSFLYSQFSYLGGIKWKL